MNNYDSKKQWVSICRNIFCKIQFIAQYFLGFCISVLLCWSVLIPKVQASDVEVYHQTSTSGQKTIMLMVDISQSTGSATLDVLHDYPLCLTNAVGGLLNAVPVGVNINLLNLVKVNTKASGNSASCDIVFPASLLTLLSGIDSLTGSGGNNDSNTLLGLKSSYDYVKKTCTSFNDLSSSEKTTLSLSLGSGDAGYRCSSRLTRIKNSIKNVISGNIDKNIDALPDDTYVGLTVSPSTSKYSAGMIQIPAKKLDATQRQLILNTVNNLQPSTSLDPLFTCTQNLLGLNVGAAASCLLNNTTLSTTLTTLLKDPQVSLASAYAESGAYLLSKTTKGTGAHVVGASIKISVTGTFQTVTGTVTNYFCNGVPIAGPLLCGILLPLTKTVTNILSPITNIVDILIPVVYRPCLNFDSNTGECINWGAPILSKAIPQNDYIESRSLINEVVDGLLTGLNLNNLINSVLPVGAIVTGLTGNLDNYANYYFKYDSNIDSKYSGFSNSNNQVKIGSNYSGPLSNSTNSCDVQGIYVMSGNIPSLSSANTESVALGIQRVMQKSLGATPTTSLDANYCAKSLPAGWGNGTTAATWSCIAAYTQLLLNQTQSIKTGVAGVGREFSTVTVDDNSNVSGASASGNSSLALVLNSLFGVLKPLLPGVTDLLQFLIPTASSNPDDIANMARWGVLGQGGWYSDSSEVGLSQGIWDFYNKLTLSQTSNVLDSYTVPTDPLDAYNLQTYTYQNMFQANLKQGWFGNIKKFGIASDGTITTADQWNNAAIASSTNILTGGVWDKLPLGNNTNKVAQRNLFMNRACDTSNKKFQEVTSLTQITKSYISQTCGPDTNKLPDDLRGYLMRLLGYNLSLSTITSPTTTTLTDDVLNSAGTISNYKLGMPLHSTPLMITQSSSVAANGSLSGRDDYIVFGSTQGLLHVVKAGSSSSDEGGKEVFAFLPNEMLQSDDQRKMFIGSNLNSHTNSFSNMQYGVDGAWTAYTEYVYKIQSDQLSLTVGSGDNNASGKQWLYGGLRMGGRSYYALDLGDIDQPKMKFHINPDAATTGTPLSYMGQSWSKPTIAWVKWKGVRKLVMFVGGGYDATGTFTCTGFTALNNKGYECPTYQQTNGKGAGVYMFDANNGDLLWWTSANATASNTGTAKFTTNTDMKYSVVSRINTKDRDGDGLVDHLYFGDLGGQVWRADLNNNLASDSTADFATHVVRLLNLHATDGTSPRFYEAPNFSVYGYGANTLAVISIAAGNRSLPVSDITTIGAIYNIFDRDVTKTSLYSLSASQLSSTVSTLGNGGLVDLSNISNLTARNLPTYGWYQKLTTGYKVMGEMAVLNKSLYASIYNPSGGSTQTCGVGVKGESSIHRYCLPYGVCEQILTTDVNSFKVGNGIMPVTIGAATNGTRQVIGGTSSARPSASVGGVAKSQTIRRQIVPLKWYEQDSP
ncbi:hypothetical protein L2096_03185 [Acinetobacter sp. ACZLY 512]|uniref:pilus assembly protein n=1 Tax=Acinetobacter sp. ACZLY 512 TaxID=2911206 RepID=UPI002027633E|nr:PilC/PilY family type IV pilus protein [Acinetobacter sp. ACZLY 512]MCL9675242.1 hypothetical protein [Acinetobacter sp. ACZLY 512]